MATAPNRATSGTRSAVPLLARVDVVVVGGGMAGLTSALRLREAGRRVALVQKGLGGLQLSQGSLDVLGYAPERVTRPYQRVQSYAEEHPEHPYAVIGVDHVREGVRWFADAVGPDLLVLDGDADQNLQLPTAVGAVRPTAVASPSMVQGACVQGARFLIVGPHQFKDFHPHLVAQNLDRTDLPDGGRLQARAATIDIEGRPGEADSTGLSYARSLDDPAYRTRFAALVRAVAREGETVGLPGFLGFRDHAAWRDLQDRIGAPVFEVPLPPPGVPGMRLNATLITRAKKDGVQVVLGSFATGVRTSDGHVTGVVVDAAGGERLLECDHVVLAPGGFESGALAIDSRGVVSERLLGLPLAGLDDLVDGSLIHGDYWGKPQPLFRVGVRVDSAMRVLDADGRPVLDNLHAAGGILAGATRWQDKSGDGIALGSAVAAANAILEEGSR